MTRKRLPARWPAFGSAMSFCRQPGRGSDTSQNHQRNRGQTSLASCLVVFSTNTCVPWRRFPAHWLRYQPGRDVTLQQINQQAYQDSLSSIVLVTAFVIVALHVPRDLGSRKKGKVTHAWTWHVCLTPCRCVTPGATGGGDEAMSFPMAALSCGKVMRG